MKKVILVASVFLSFISTQAHAGSNECLKEPVITQITGEPLAKKHGIFNVSAVRQEWGCASRMIVTLGTSFPMNEEFLNILDFMYIRTNTGLGFPTPGNVNHQAVRLLNNQIVIEDQLILGDTLYITVPTVGVFGYSLKQSQK